MSSGGGQWRLIRHILSTSNLNAELEKWYQRVKPLTAHQLEELMKKFDGAVTARMKRLLESSEVKQENGLVKATPAEEAQTGPEKAEEKSGGPGELSVGSEAKEITISGLWQGLKLKKDLHFGNISQPTWKANRPVVTKTSIHSRTAYVISALVTAESAEGLLRRTEHFIDHLKQYPEARDYAIKEGAVRALLRAQHALAGEPEVAGPVREALALVGWAGAPRGAGANVLALDGGGVRGLVAIELLRHLERLTARPVHELFDYVIGVSTGAIIAAVVGGGVGSLETASRMYHTLSREMFGNTSLLGGTSRLVWTHSYYDTGAWEALLRANLGAHALSACARRGGPYLALVSCAVRGGAGARPAPFVFRSYECGFRVRSAFAGTSRAQLWQAVRASAAAPTYFEEFRLGARVHQDGGLVANNPAAVGLHEARLLFGAEAVARGTLVSVGTGRAPRAHADFARMAQGAGAPPAAGTSWRDKFGAVLDSATDTERVHLALADLLPAGHYFRLDPPLVDVCAMDEVDPDRLQGLVVDAQAYIRRNQHKFERAAAMLTRQRGLAQRLLDLAQRRAHMMGLAGAP